MKKNLFLFSIMFLSAFYMKAQEIIIGTGTDCSNIVAFVPDFTDSWCENLYLASEIGGSGSITSISFQHDGGAQLTCANVYIYMGHRTNSYYSSSNDWTASSELTLVYSGTNVTIGATAGWEQFDLSVPFNYNGTDNLVVVLAKHATSYAGNLSYYYTDHNNYRCLCKRGYNTPNLAQHPGQSYGNRFYDVPNIKLVVNNENCVSPMGVQVSNITDVGCTINWLNNEENNSFSYQIKAYNEDWNTATLETSSDTSLLFNTLSPNTSYDFRIRVNCGDTVSTWVYKTFTTNSIPAVIPYFCNFNNENENIHWLFSTTTGNHWIIGNGTSFDNDSTDNALYVSNNDHGNYAADSIPDSYLFAERLINFSEEPDTYVIGLDWKASGSVNTNNQINSALFLYIRDANESTPSGLPTYINEKIQHAVHHNNWVHTTIQLDSISGVKKLQFFTWGYTETEARVVPAAIDNISIEVADCITPTMTISTTDVTATVTHNGPEAGEYLLIYRPLTANDSTITTISFSGSTSTLTDLNPNTYYIAWIRQMCDFDTSALTPGVVFSTQCGLITVTDDNPWFDDFSLEPQCWQLPLNNDNRWVWYANSRFLGHAFGNYQCYAITPEIDITEVSIPYLKFKQRRPDYQNSGICDHLTVYYRSTAENSDTNWYILNTYTAVANSWTTDSLALPYNLSTIQLKFQAIGNGDNADGCYIDNVQIYNEDNAATCRPPVHLSANSITAESAELSWTLTDDYPLTLFYKEDYMEFYTEIAGVTLTDGVFQLDNLNAQTTYNWYLAITCENGSISNTAVNSFTTDCASIMVTNSNSWTENFTTEPNNCWDFEYYFHNNYHNFFTWKYNNDGYLYHEYGNYNIGAITPLMDISTITTPYVKFLHKQPAFNNSADHLIVFYRTSTNDEWVELASFSEAVEEWQLDSLILPNASETYQLKFKAIGTNNGNGCAFDSISVYNELNPPTCHAPILTSSNNITSTSAELSWTMVSEGHVNLFYKSTSDNIYTMIEDVILVEGIYTLNGLTANTTYQWYLSINCEDGTSINSYVKVFSTLCGAYNVDYLQDFESTSGNEIPDCWDRLNVYQDVYPAVFSSNLFAHSGQQALLFRNDFVNVIPQYAIMPEFSIGFNDLQLNFWTRREGVESGTFSVGYMNDTGDENSFVEVWSINSAQIGDNDYHNYTIRFDTVPFENSHPYRIAFKYVSSSNWYWYLDDISVTLIPDCDAPDSLVASNLTSSSADLSWISNANSCNLYYKKTDDTVFVEIANIMPFGGYVYTLENLSAGTHYEWYVTAICEDGTLSVSFTRGHFNTVCGTISSLPTSWNFEDNANSGSLEYALPLCWERSGGNPYYPYTYNQSSVAHSGDNSLLFNNYYPNTYAILPAINTDSLNFTDLQVSFYAKISNTNAPCILEIGVIGNPAEPNTFTPIGALNLSPAYTFYEIPLINHTGLGQHIAFRNIVQGTAYSHIYIDDVTLEEAPNCSRPLFLTACPDTNSVLLSWISTASEFTLYYKALGSHSWQSINNVTLDENNEYELIGLSAGVHYDWYVETLCSIDTEMVSTIHHFSTLQQAVALPFHTTFAITNEWYLNNSNCANYWTTGIASDATEPALFITNNGTAASYNNSISSTVMAEKLFIMPTDEDSIYVEFDVQVGGEGSLVPFDYLKVFLAPSSTEFISSSDSNAQSNPSYSTYALDFTAYKHLTGNTNYPYALNLTQNNIIHISMNIVKPDTSGKAKFVFLWRNDNSVGTMPAAIIRNFFIRGCSDTNAVYITNPSVVTNTATNITQTSATLNGSITNPDNVPITSKGFEWKEASSSNSTTVYASEDSLTHELNELSANTTYTYRSFIRFNNTSVYGDELSFTTLEEEMEPCDTPTNLTITDISATSATISWTPGGNESAWNIQYKLASVASDEWGELIHVTNTPSYTITDLAASTAYQVRVQADCGDNNLSYFLNDGFTTEVGIHSIELANHISLQPNPADKYIELNIHSNIVMTEAMVYNAFGQLIQTVQLTDNHARIDLSNMAAGMYFVRVNGDKVTATKKFIRK